MSLSLSLISHCPFACPYLEGNKNNCSNIHMFFYIKILLISETKRAFTKTGFRYTLSAILFSYPDLKIRIVFPDCVKWRVARPGVRGYLRDLTRFIFAFSFVSRPSRQQTCLTKSNERSVGVSRWP